MIKQLKVIVFKSINILTLILFFRVVLEFIFRMIDNIKQNTNKNYDVFKMKI